ncbi:histidine kinase [Photobacterium proteolyticum]|uniref:Histidine kinase n=1 Tax=Photobacterium proteolyticum TaxID=1903952 RepID=A0A1Q9G9X7_9GAMM|nr:diguanylate cyclase [Photobacterium proteolyticum]OLQ71141.1 histidine kinase [Photobacterium proteolyticum]
MAESIDKQARIQVIGDPIEELPTSIDRVDQWDIYKYPSVLVNVEPARQDEILLKIRSDELRRLQPVFCVSRSKMSDVLSDGYLEQMRHRIPSIIEKLSLLHKTPHPEPLDLLAWYCWPRSHFHLTPVWSAIYQKGYRYPLLDCLVGIEANLALMRAVEHHLLLPGKLIDRIRLCRNCQSGRLNYVDVCPECNSIDIHLKPGVHCFVCGYVDDQDVFIQSGVMKCPKCSTKLRHIGVDYDRPLERYSCYSCYIRFIEAVVKARCHDCGEVQSPDDLTVSTISEFQVGKLARQIALEGSHLLHLPLAWGAPITVDHLPWLLQWTSSNQNRYGGDNTVMLIWLSNLSEVKIDLGLLRVQERLKELVKRMQGIFRETDVVCQYSDDILILLLPHTSERVWEALRDRIASLSEVEGLDKLEVVVQVQALPVPEGKKAEDWLKEWISTVTHYDGDVS